MPRPHIRRPDAPTVCPACGDDKARIVQRLEPLFEPDVVGDFRYEITACDACGEEILSFEQAEAHARAYAAAVARARGAMTPDRIYELRQSLGWTQENMQEAFGVGPKTWGRWERGMVAPTGPATKLMWLAENNRAAFLQLVDAHRRAPSLSASVVGTIAPQGAGEAAVWYRRSGITASREGKADTVRTHSPTNGGPV